MALLAGAAMIRELVKGFTETMALTCFRGPWAYENMARIEAAEPSSAYELGEWVAVVMVRADERRRSGQPNSVAARSTDNEQEKKT